MWYKVSPGLTNEVCVDAEMYIFLKGLNIQEECNVSELFERKSNIAFLSSLASLECFSATWQLTESKTLMLSLLFTDIWEPHKSMQILQFGPLNEFLQPLSVNISRENVQAKSDWAQGCLKIKRLIKRWRLHTTFNWKLQYLFVLTKAYQFISSICKAWMSINVWLTRAGRKQN